MLLIHKNYYYIKLSFIVSILHLLTIVTKGLSTMYLTPQYRMNLATHKKNRFVKIIISAIFVIVMIGMNNNCIAQDYGDCGCTKDSLPPPFPRAIPFDAHLVSQLKPLPDTTFESCMMVHIQMAVCRKPITHISFTLCLADTCDADSVKSVGYSGMDSSHGQFTDISYPRWAHDANKNCLDFNMQIDTAVGSYPFPTSIYLPNEGRDSAYDTSIIQYYVTCIDTWFDFTLCPVKPACDSTMATLSFHSYHADGTSDSGTYTQKVSEASGDSILIADRKNKNNNQPTAMFIYPNPAAGTPSVSVDYVASEDGPVDIRLFNSSGQEISVNKLTASKGEDMVIPLSLNRTCPNGIYFCRIAQQHDVSTKMIVIAH
jgi:hypothetical protein